MLVRPIEQGDLPSFREAAARFFHESRNRKYEADVDKFMGLVEAAVSQPEKIRILVCLDAEKVVGYSILNTFADYTEFALGDMYQMYVLPEYRGKGVGRALRDAVVNVFDDEWQCPISHVCADTGIDDEEVHHIPISTTTKAFVNLWAKAGYKLTGVIMTREKPEA